MLPLVSLMLKLPRSWLCYALSLLCWTRRKLRNLAGREEPHEPGEGTLTQLDATCRILFKEQSLLPLGSHFPKALSQKVLTIFRFEKPYLVHSWLCHVKFQDSVLDSHILPCVFRPSSFHNLWHPVIVSFLPQAKTLEHVL